MSGIVFLLFVIDLKPSDRLLSLCLAPIAFAGAFFLASFLANNYWLNNLILLLLFFLSYFFRRYGTRAGELVLISTVGFYLGFLQHPPQSVYPLFLTAVIVSALGVILWLFVIMPYDPAKSLRRSVNAFYHNVARTIAFTREGLESAPGDPQYSKKLQGRFKQVHQNRNMIEGLFSAIVSPTIWSQPRLNQLQEEMFKTERGLEMLIEAATQISVQLDEIPADVYNTMTQGLSTLENQLWGMASGEAQAQLAEIGTALQSQLKTSLEQKPHGKWVNSSCGLVSRLASLPAPSWICVPLKPPGMGPDGWDSAKITRHPANATIYGFWQEVWDRAAPYNHSRLSSGSGYRSVDVGGLPAENGPTEPGLLDGFYGHRRIDR